MARLFISQNRLDVWSDENRIRLSGDVMTLAADGRSFKLVPAVRFVKVSDDGADVLQLVGKVKTQKAVIAAGGEHVATSVLYADTAYDVQQGYLGEPQPGRGA